jgi:hypothetical protein
MKFTDIYYSYRRITHNCGCGYQTCDLQQHTAPAVHRALEYMIINNNDWSPPVSSWALGVVYTVHVSITTPIASALKNYCI